MVCKQLALFLTRHKRAEGTAEGSLMMFLIEHKSYRINIRVDLHEADTKRS